TATVAARRQASGCSWNSRASPVSDPRRTPSSPRKSGATSPRTRETPRLRAPSRASGKDKQAMRRFVTFRCAPALGAALLAPAVQGAHAQTRELATRGEMLDRVVAIVNEGVVLNSDLDAETAAVSERLREQKLEAPPQNVLRQQVLERLVLTEIQ